MKEPEVLIVRRLLQAGDRFVSGNDLGTELGLSRVSVWTEIERLRKAGFSFEAAPRRGYRLIDVPNDLNPILVKAHCSLRSMPRIEFREEIDSTNSEAERLLASGTPTPLVVLSRSQTQGRGRLGRVWASPDTGNIYASFAFRPHIPPSRMQTFTLWMGVNICETLRNFGRFSPAVKWPNDIIHDGRKLGGMLTEARIDTDQIHDVIFGLGLNVNVMPSQWPKELIGSATSMAEILGTTIDINRMTAALLGRIVNAYDCFVEDEHTIAFAEMWERFDLLRDHPITVHQGNEYFAGIARGIDSQGGLRLELEDGSILPFLAGDATLDKSVRT
jgi:BirA family biotin operon repressor/biotin-[acetyl-CoA-carboxylase] ligase